MSVVDDVILVHHLQSGTSYLFDVALAPAEDSVSFVQLTPLAQGRLHVPPDPRSSPPLDEQLANRATISDGYPSSWVRHVNQGCHAMNLMSLLRLHFNPM